MTERVLFSLLLAWLCATVEVASAQVQAQVQAQAQARPPSCEEDPGCATLMEQAYVASQKGLFAEAQDAYEQAYRVRPDPKLLYNLARVLHKAGRAADALPYYQRYLETGSRDNDKQRRKAEQYLAEARIEATLQRPTSEEA